MSEKVVTRFAPSPTGYLHVGGARTALFNWLYARRMGGIFILRIEDTDQKRNTPTAIQQVIDDLRWLGIEWDEGPEVGGLNGPYIQSQRRDIYDKYIKKLIEDQKAYWCFDTPEELDELRQEAEAQKKNFIYPRPKEFLDENDVKKAIAKGKPVTVRFAIPQEANIVVSDIIRGEVTFSASEIGDFIIQKSDGFPTYNFACVVDDYLMKVTHIIRGQEHLMNTPGQQELWKALGFGELPKYAHMSVTISDDGGKLSKRERPKALCKTIKALVSAKAGAVGKLSKRERPKALRQDIQDIVVDVEALRMEVNLPSPKIVLKDLAEVGNLKPEELQSFIEGKTTPDMPGIDAMAKYLGVQLPEINVVDFFKSGYLPETMVNFLALLGWNPGDKREIISVDELISCFDLSRLTKANSLFDRQKLIAFNTEHIKLAGKEKLLCHFKDYLKAIKSPVANADDKTLARIIELCAGARTLADIEHKSRFLFLDNDKIEYDEKAVKKVLLKGDGVDILQIIRSKIETQAQITAQYTEEMLRSLAEEKKVGLGQVAQPLRVAICGTTISTPIFDSVEMLGKEKTLARIDNAVRIVQTKAII